MSAIHVSVRPLPDRAPSPALAPVYGLFDVVVDGVNVTARIGEGQALAFLAELGHAVTTLCTGRRDRVSVQLYTDDEPWELGLEASDGDALLTVYRAGPNPEVAVHERVVSFAALRQAVRSALDEPAPPRTPEMLRAALAAAARALDATWPPRPRAAVQRVSVTVSPRPVRGVAFTAELDLRRGGAPRTGGQLERADLHGLLAMGTLAAEIRGRRVPLGRVHAFLFAEKLIGLADETLEAWQAGRPLFRRAESEGARLGVRLGPGDAPLALAVSGPEQRATGERLTFPEVEPAGFVTAVVRFADGLLDAILRHDPAQAQNLRLTALRERLATLRDRAEDAVADDAVTNPEPDAYRSFGPARRTSGEARGPWEHGGKMRFLPRWVATVPGIDLTATFQCGDRLVVGAQRETAAIDRDTGHVLWRVPTPRAACVATPLGLARMHPEGRVTLLDLGTGETVFSTQLAPRSAGGAAGAVVQAPGLPRVLVLTEGDRRVTALDLQTGDVRWRYTARRPAGYRVRRAGRLLLVAGGDTALVALDVTSGEVVWRLRDRLPFTGDVTVDQDAAFAVGGTPTATARLHRIDPWTGELVWSADVDERSAGGVAPLVVGDVVVVVVKDRRGMGLKAFDRATGVLRWSQAPGLVSPTTAWTVVDDALMGNAASGLFVCVDATTGLLRYSHVFSRHVDADQPRRLEPVLRGGALFVPQHEVQVLRPRDGEVLGILPCDLIPDLLRVDERCNVTVAEESGHLAVFGAAPRLSLVKA